MHWTVIDRTTPRSFSLRFASALEPFQLVLRTASRATWTVTLPEHVGNSVHNLVASLQAASLPPASRRVGRQQSRLRAWHSVRKQLISQRILALLFEHFLFPNRLVSVNLGDHCDCHAVVAKCSTSGNNLRDGGRCVLSGLSIGLIVGGCLLLLAGIGFCFWRRARKSSPSYQVLVDGPVNDSQPSTGDNRDWSQQPGSPYQQPPQPVHPGYVYQQ